MQKYPTIHDKLDKLTRLQTKTPTSSPISINMVSSTVRSLLLSVLTTAITKQNSIKLIYWLLCQFTYASDIFKIWFFNKRGQMQKSILNVYNFTKKAQGERTILKTFQNIMHLISCRVESCREMKEILVLPSSR
jgi:hypothetical protein